MGKSSVTQELRDIKRILEAIARFEGPSGEILSLRREAKSKAAHMNDLIRKIRRAFDAAEA